MRLASQCVNSLTEAARARGLRAREARDFLHDAAQARLPTNDGSYVDQWGRQRKLQVAASLGSVQTLGELRMRGTAN